MELPAAGQEAAESTALVASQVPATEPFVLIVEDDGEIRRLLVRLLRENGYRAIGTGDGREMWLALAAGRPDLILLDLMLPVTPGLDLLRALRHDERWSGLPVIAVTAKGGVGDRTLGLELGADDYVAKPFDQRELLARIAAVLRRTGTLNKRAAGQVSRGRQLRFAGWSLDTSQRLLTSPSGAAVDLSGAEYDLLAVFLDNPGRTLSRERLLELARNRVSVAVADRSVDVQVSRLRQKLESETDRDLIKTVRGIGYVFTAELSE